MAQLVEYNPVAAGSDAEGTLARVTAADHLVLPGGLQAVDGDREVNPSCCCGLEDWRDWIEFVRSGQSPWLGHDPAPWLESAGGVVRAWSDGGMNGPASDAFAVEFEREQFVAAVDRVGRDLSEFLSRVGEWSRTVGVADPAALCGKLDACFNINGAHG